jgi:hypothetical protein
MIGALGPFGPEPAEIDVLRTALAYTADANASLVKFGYPPGEQDGSEPYYAMAMMFPTGFTTPSWMDFMDFAHRDTSSAGASWRSWLRATTTLRRRTRSSSPYSPRS